MKYYPFNCCHFDKCFFVLYLLLVSFSVFGRTVITINSQDSFNELNRVLLKTITDGETDIVVSFLPGTYIMNEQHISLVGVNAPCVNLHFYGNGSVLMPAGKEYRDGDRYEGNFSPLHSWMNGSSDVETWTYVRFAEGLVTVMDETKKTCRIKVANAFPKNTDFSRGYILIPHWYSSSVCKITSIEDNYIYFTASDLRVSARGNRDDYNLNDDHSYGKTGKVRYKLFNIETGEDVLRIINGRVHLPVGVQTAWEGRISRLITIEKCQFASVEFNGIRFVGGSTQNSVSIIGLRALECNVCRFAKCEFRGARGNVIEAMNVDNLHVENCIFSDCHHSGVRADNECKNTHVINNEFLRMGGRMAFTHCIAVRGENYYVFGNTLVNFGYSGIGVGVPFSSQKNNPSCGVVENNSLTYDTDYMANIANYGMMDSGAIYLWTKNDGAVIRGNRIIGYSGMSQNRGVFCDDGAFNFEISGNVIININNGFCIDSWRCASVEEKYTVGSGIKKSNVNISIHDNVVNGSIRFAGNESVENGCVFGNNYVLLDDDETLPTNAISNARIIGNSIALSYTGRKRGRIGVSRKSYRLLKQNPYLSNNRSLFVGNNK